VLHSRSTGLGSGQVPVTACEGQRPVRFECMPAEREVGVRPLTEVRGEPSSRLLSMPPRGGDRSGRSPRLLPLAWQRV
jgi:hypothetical protein